MTADFVRRLPFFLPRSTVIQVTGLSEGGVRTAVESGALRVYRDGPDRRNRYYRVDVERMIGLHDGETIKNAPQSPTTPRRGLPASTPGQAG
jgi:hypothetical protein